jgi:hypothetical protein
MAMLRAARSVLAAFALLFAAALLIPFGYAHLRPWAEARDFHLTALQNVEPAIDTLGTFTATTTFMFLTGFLIGGALLVWVDFGLRQRTRKMGLILASVGLLTFVIGVSIYLFPRQSAYMLAANAKPAPPPPAAKEPEREPLVWSKTPILRWTRDADGALCAHTLGFVGKNIGAEDVQLDAIYIVSRATSARMDLKVQIGTDDAVAVEDTNPVPPDAYIQLSSDEFNPTEGIPEANFLRDWGTIDFVVEYDGKKHRMTFEQPMIASLFEAERPKPPPAVTRKSEPRMTLAPAPAAKPEKAEAQSEQKAQVQPEQKADANSPTTPGETPGSATPAQKATTEQPTPEQSAGEQRTPAQRISDAMQQLSGGTPAQAATSPDTTPRQPMPAAIAHVDAGVPPTASVRTDSGVRTDNGVGANNGARTDRTAPADTGLNTDMSPVELHDETDEFHGPIPTPSAH